ncbi:type II secretion system protein GspG, partial [Escherichia coli]
VYIKRLPCRSPGGNDYVLVNPGEHGAYDLLSAGPDGLYQASALPIPWGQ